MDKSTKILIVVSDFWRVEAPFLIPELKKLSDNFFKITIINTNKVNTNKNQFEKSNKLIFKNISIIDFDLNPKFFKNKYIFLSIFFKSYFYRELYFIFKRFKIINISMIKDIFNYYIKARLLNSKIKNNLNYNENDILYSYWLDFTSFAIVIGNFGLVKRVSRAHNWDVYFERKDNNYLPFRTTILNKLDGFFPISQNANDYLRKVTSSDGSNFFTSRLGVDSPIKAKKKSLKNDFTILSFSYISPVKRLDLIVEALTFINNDLIVNWVHIGPGDFFDEFSSYVKSKLDKQKNINYELKGFLTTQEISEFLSKTKIDLHINTSSYEGIPVSIMEAMSYGIPTLATDVGGTSEIVNAKNGFLIDANSSPKFISEKILEFKNLTAQKRLSMINEAHQTWSEKFSSEKNYSEFAEKLSSL